MTWYERMKPKVTIKKQKSMEALDKLRTYATDSRRWPDFQTHLGDMIGKRFYFYRPSALSTTSSASVGLPRKNYGSTTCRFSFWTKQSGRPDFSNYFLNILGVAMPFLTAALQRPQTHSWWKRWMLTLWNFWRIQFWQKSRQIMINWVSFIRFPLSGFPLSGGHCSQVCPRHYRQGKDWGSQEAQLRTNCKKTTKIFKTLHRF